jgi:hypothetical protein
VSGYLIFPASVTWTQKNLIDELKAKRVEKSNDSIKEKPILVKIRKKTNSETIIFKPRLILKKKIHGFNITDILFHLYLVTKKENAYFLSFLEIRLCVNGLNFSLHNFSQLYEF